MSESIPGKGPEFNITNKEFEPSKEPENTTDSFEKEGNVVEKSIEELTKSVEAHAVSGKEIGKNEHADAKQHPMLINKQLKEMAYSRALTRMRKNLSLPSRLFSYALHSKVLDRPSEAIGKTIARPSGMLGGAVFAMFGTSTLLWITKKQGYQFNYLMVVILFVAGMVIGLVAESIIKFIRSKK